MSLFVLMSSAMPNESGEFSLLLDQIAEVKEKNNVAGLALIIVDDQEILHQAYLGLASRNKKYSVSADTVFRIGSITKTFTAMAVLRLHEQGKLNLNDPIANYLRILPYQSAYEETAPIRIAHVLEHTAGFQDMTQKEFDFKQENWSLEQSFDYDPASRLVAWRPGEYYSYSNIGAGIAAKIVEVVSQQPFEQYVEEQIFTPLALEDATFFLAEQIRSRLATGYDTDGETVIPYWHMLYRSFGAMNVRLSDMAKFLQMLINHGKTSSGDSLFSMKAIQRLETPVTSLAARHGLKFGYGLGNYQWLSNGVLFHGHGGDADGYLAHYGYTHEFDQGYFIVINAFNNRALRAIRNLIEAWMTAGIKVQDPPEYFRLTAEQIGEITGKYASVTQRFSWQETDQSTKLKIFVDKDRLFSQQDSQSPQELIPVNNHHFRRPHQPIATISIIKNTSDIPVVQGDIGNFIKID